MEWLAGINLVEVANALVILIVGVAAGLGFTRGKAAQTKPTSSGLEVATDFFDSQAIKFLTTEVTGQAVAITAQTTAIREQTEEAERLRLALDHVREALDRHAMAIAMRR